MISRINNCQYKEYSSVPAQERINKIARLYVEVFADPPWNEYKECPNGHNFGREAKEICIKCKGPLKLFYSKEERALYIEGELKKPNGTLIALEDEEPIAAGWGYACGVKDLQAKYKSEEMRKKCEVVGLETFFYLSEIMVSQEARGRGIGKKISRLLLEKANSLGMKLILRTREDSEMCFIAQKMGMVRIIEEDSENKGRVLYMQCQ